MKAFDIVKIILLAVIVVLLGIILYHIPQPFECGTCGAHVYNVWHTQSDDGELIHICARCADIADND